MKISTAQFEHKSGDKAYNLSVIEKLAGWRLRKDQRLSHFMSVP